MKITIITVCFNAASTISDALNSVAKQKNVDVEHIVIDGASTDRTLEIVKTYTSVSILVSEPDKGIYDAMNKGIALATGDVVGILNADDIYMDNNVLQEVIHTFSDNAIDACYGDLVYVDKTNTNQVVRYWKSAQFIEGMFKSGWAPAHPTFFVRNDIYKKFSGFNLKYQLAADFEILFRFLEQHKINSKYLPKVFVKMRLGGATNKSLTNVYRQNKEIVEILRSYYKKVSLISFIVIKVVARMTQFFTRPSI